MDILRLRKKQARVDKPILSYKKEEVKAKTVTSDVYVDFGG